MQPSPARLWLSRWTGRLQTALVLLLMAASFAEVRSNFAEPRWMRYKQPEFFQTIIRYGRLYQYWRMFSPDPPTFERMITVEAVTADGRLVDPYNEVASLHSRPPFEEFPERLGYDQFFSNYAKRITFEKYTGYRPGLKRWILRYHLRTGNPRDRIVSFKAIELQAKNPKPGEEFEPNLIRRSPFMEHPPKPRRGT